MTIITGRLPSVEEQRSTALRYLHEGHKLVDVIEKSRENPTLVLRNDHPAFFARDNPYFDYVKPEILNQMVSEGLIAVATAPWDIIYRDHPDYDVRRFTLTDSGRQYLERNTK